MLDILLIPHIHFDPTWRRCFDRPAVKHGVTVRPYSEVEALCIERFLKLAPKGYPFSEGQAAVWRKYLERNPGRLPLLRRLARKGTLDVMLAGETVQDTNLPSAEGLVRNFLTAMPLYETLCGADCRGLKLGWVEDAFGNSPNYPQILRGVGAEVACVISYRRLPGDVWQGIDGTRIPCYDRAPKMFSGMFEKLPPCDSCRGKGCPACGDTGLLRRDRLDLEHIESSIRHMANGGLEVKGQADGGAFAVEQKGANAKSALPWCVMSISVEEVLPDARLVALVEKLNAEFAGRARVRFANPSDQYALQRDSLQRLAEEGAAEPPHDLNPGMPGGYVTRIRCKQRARATAYNLLRAESSQAVKTWAKGAPQPPPAEMAEAWRNTVFTHFHDAITGTHIDHAYAELMDMLDAADATAFKNGARKPAPAPAFKALPRSGKAPAKPKKIRLGELQVEYDLIGIRAVLAGGEDLCGTLRTYASFRRDIRPAELVLDSDVGDAWGRRIGDFPEITRPSTHIPLGAYNDSVETDGHAIRWRGRYRGGNPMVKKLAWTVTCRASCDGRRLDFLTEVDWDTHSHRLMVVFPVKSQETSATYEVPYGFIERAFDPARLDFTQWMANGMDFPALHWVNRRLDASRGVAVLNKGLPCNRWVPGRFDLSLLRSPEWYFCSVEPGSYEFWDVDSQRDTGRHRFEYSLWPYANGVGEAELTRAGYAYNDALPAHPFTIRGDAIATAFKCAENGAGWVLRVQETAGRESAVEIDFGRAVAVCPANLLEQPSAPFSAPSPTHALRLRPHEIHTLLLAHF